MIRLLLLNLFMGFALALLAQPLQAMPTVLQENADSKVLNAKIVEQNGAYTVSDFARAHKLNLELEKPVRKASKNSPELFVALMVDRAVILDRLGMRKQAVLLLDGVYVRNGFEPLLSAFNADYYAYAVGRTYAAWLADIDKGKAELVLDTLAKRILRLEAKHQPLYAMQYPVEAIDRYRKHGSIEQAQSMCSAVFEWLGRTSPDSYGKMPSYHGTIMLDEGQSFVTDLALRTSNDAFFQYLTADANDSCAAVNEHVGKLDVALAQRLRSRDAILKSDQAAFARVIDLRLARLFAFTDMPDVSRYHLERAWQAYQKEVGATAETQICNDLKFYFDGTAMQFVVGGIEISPADVWKRMSANIAAAEGADIRFDCAQAAA